MRNSPTIVRRLALAIGAPVLAFGVVEAGFRIAGYSYDPSPMDLLVTGADPLREATVVDDDVFWTLRRSQRYQFADIEIVTNELGTRGDLPPREKAPGTIRIVCLGDSTAFGGHTTYPAQLEQVLKSCAPDVRVEVINAGVPGWTTYQGTRLFQRDLMRWKPDIVTASFGFNNAKREPDGVTDRQRATVANAGAARVVRRLKASRFVQWLVAQRDARRDTRVRFDATSDWQPLRCPPADHARCLSELAASCREIGAKLLLASQPHGFAWKDGDAVGELPPAAIHDVAARLDEQNVVVSRSAAELNVRFVDVAAQFRTLHSGDVYVDPLPGRDPLHTTAYGARRVAEALADAALDAGWIPSTQRASTRPFRSCGPIASIATDVDGDGLDEVLLAAVVDGTTRLRLFDPRSGSTRDVSAELPTPDANFELAQIPLLGGSLLLSVPITDRAGNWLLVADEAGSTRRLTEAPTMVTRNAVYQVVPLQLTEDGDPEYAVCTSGVEGAPWLLLLSSTGQPRFTGSAKRDTWSAGVRLRAIDDGSGRGTSVVAVTPCIGPAFVMKVSADGRFETLLSPRRLGRFAPTDLVAGRFGEDARESYLLLNAPLVLEWQREFLGATYFPYGSAEFDPRVARPVLSRIERKGASVIVLGLRTGETIRLFEVAGDRVAPLAEIDVPRAP